MLEQRTVETFTSFQMQIQNSNKKLLIIYLQN